jgi:ribosomal protein L44E
MWQKIGQHPYAMYRQQRMPDGRILIQFHCRACGDQHQHMCQNPARLSQWLYRYAGVHAHGLRPVAP